MPIHSPYTYTVIFFTRCPLRADGGGGVARRVAPVPHSAPDARRRLLHLGLLPGALRAWQYLTWVVLGQVPPKPSQPLLTCSTSQARVWFLLRPGEGRETPTAEVQSSPGPALGGRTEGPGCLKWR